MRQGRTERTQGSEMGKKKTKVRRCIRSSFFLCFLAGEVPFELSHIISKLSNYPNSQSESS